MDGGGEAAQHADGQFVNSASKARNMTYQIEVFSYGPGGRIGAT